MEDYSTRNTVVQQPRRQGARLSGIERVTDADLLAAAPPLIDWVLPGALPAGELGILAGADGSGKSFLALLAAMSVAYQLPWSGGLLPAPGVAGDVIYVAGEDDRDELARRVHAIHTVMSRVPGPGAGAGRIHFVPLDAEPCRLAVAGRQDAAPLETLETGALRDLVLQVQPRLVILDPLIMFHALSELDSQHMDTLARIIIRTVRAVPGCAALVVHHAAQDAARAGADDHFLGRGSTALNAAARAVFSVRRLNQAEAAKFEEAGELAAAWRVVRGPKVSRGPEMAGAYLRLDAETGVPVLAQPPGLAAAGGNGNGQRRERVKENEAATARSF